MVPQPAWFGTLVTGSRVESDGTEVGMTARIGRRERRAVIGHPVVRGVERPAASDLVAAAIARRRDSGYQNSEHQESGHQEPRSHEQGRQES